MTLAQTPVTDAALKSLAKFPKLNEVDLGGTKVTTTGLSTFQQALPNCKIRFSAAPPQDID